ncbi:MAG: helix-hairpin-helix domain-containing protein [Prevotellaceae bacterium]|jgi:DNA uptake protein ComE-like DNA-binding protein|nr:helix-hairpin-helix domain-containing protein [Prevotellaceae bacterium]
MREFLYYTRNQRRGILLLALLTGVLLVVGGWLSHRQHKAAVASREREIAFRSFADSMQQLETRARGHDAAAGWRRPPKPDPPVLAPFDPNSADSVSLRRLGIPAWMARNILRYRAKGGKFKKAEDFKKIYGMDEERYRTLAPYLYIAHNDSASRRLRGDSSDNALYTPMPRVAATEKYPEGTLVDLNSADTTELKKIPGIGSGIARLIVGYRQQLGGYYRTEQLREIRLNDEALKGWFVVSDSAIRRINLNKAGVDRLRAHPYINFYQARAIVEYRKKHGALNSLKPFTLYEEFTPEALERISHYVCFR